MTAAPTRVNSDLVPAPLGHRIPRPNAGVTMVEWIDLMQTWGMRELVGVANDPGSPSVQAAAARLWMNARAEGHARNGRPLAETACREILDRRIGRPKQQVEVTRVTRSDPAQLEAALVRLIQAHPALVQDVVTRLGLGLATPASPTRVVVEPGQGGPVIPRGGEPPIATPARLGVPPLYSSQPTGPST